MVWPPAAAGAMDDAIHAAFQTRDYRDHESIVANRDVLLLQHAFIPMGFEESFERLMNRFLLTLDIAAQPM